MERALDLYAAGDNQWNEWNRTRDPAALDRAVAFFLELRAISPERSARALAADALLGLSLAARYPLNESATDRDEAISHLTALTSEPDPERTWDGHRLTLAQLLLGRSTVGALPERPGEQSYRTWTLPLASRRPLSAQRRRHQRTGSQPAGCMRTRRPFWPLCGHAARGRPGSSRTWPWCLRRAVPCLLTTRTRRHCRC